VSLCLCLCDVIATDVENVWLVNFLTGEYLLYSKVSGGKVYYIVNIPGGRFAMRKVYYTIF
jgi:hypothetical protein